MRVIILVVAMILSPSWLFAGWLGPSTYEECILKEMKGVTSNQAAGLIARACRGKFPEKSLFDDTQNNPIPVRDLSNDEIAKITGSLTCFQGYLSGTLHNGNERVSIRSVNIYFQEREYEEDFMFTSPLGTSDIKLKVVGCEKGDSSWSILKAQGI